MDNKKWLPFKHVLKIVYPTMAKIAGFVAEYSDTKRIIIDTLQKVREVGGDHYSYVNDYQIIMRLKRFADAHGICLLLVNHTRKQTAG